MICLSKKGYHPLHILLQQDACGAVYLAVWVKLNCLENDWTVAFGSEW